RGHGQRHSGPLRHRRPALRRRRRQRHGRLPRPRRLRRDEQAAAGGMAGASCRQRPAAPALRPDRPAHRPARALKAMTVSPRAPDPDDDALGDALPRPPPLEDIATTGVWIVQWRDGRGPQPGTALHRWLEDRHPGWARLVDCRGRTDVVSAIKAASWFARDARASPILHLDADCDPDGLAGPERDGGRGRAGWAALAPHPARPNLATRGHPLPVCAAGAAVAAPPARGRAGWDALAPHLARLNLATRGNLLLVCAAGDGVAARLAAATGDRSPCVAVIAPASARPPPPSPWLIATRRLYHSWRQGQPG